MERLGLALHFQLVIFVVVVGDELQLVELLGVFKRLHRAIELGLCQFDFTAVGGEILERRSVQPFIGKERGDVLGFLVQVERSQFVSNELFHVVGGEKDLLLRLADRALVRRLLHVQILVSRQFRRLRTLQRGLAAIDLVLQVPAVEFHQYLLFIDVRLGDDRALFDNLQNLRATPHLLGDDH